MRLPTPTIRATISCSGERHTVTWHQGKLTLEDHDLAELTLHALGASGPNCFRFLTLWRHGYGRVKLVSSVMSEWRERQPGAMSLRYVAGGIVMLGVAQVWEGLAKRRAPSRLSRLELLALRHEVVLESRRTEGNLSPDGSTSKGEAVAVPAQSLPLRFIIRLVEMIVALTTQLPKTQYLRFLTLPWRASRATGRGELRKAERLARDALTLAERYLSDSSYGNTYHNARIVLGRVALARGDRDAARRELVESVRVTSPQLRSFGPNMLLARELLRAREIECVLEYLDLCRGFWITGAEDCHAWAEDIREGREPAAWSRLT